MVQKYQNEKNFHILLWKYLKIPDLQALGRVKKITLYILEKSAVFNFPKIIKNVNGLEIE